MALNDRKKNLRKYYDSEQHIVTYRTDEGEDHLVVDINLNGKGAILVQDGKEHFIEVDATDEALHRISVWKRVRGAV